MCGKDLTRSCRSWHNNSLAAVRAPCQKTTVGLSQLPASHSISTLLAHPANTLSIIANLCGCNYVLICNPVCELSWRCCVALLPQRLADCQASKSLAQLSACGLCVSAVECHWQIPNCYTSAICLVVHFIRSNRHQSRQFQEKCRNHCVVVFQSTFSVDSC